MILCEEVINRRFFASFFIGGMSFLDDFHMQYIFTSITTISSMRCQKTIELVDIQYELRYLLILI